MFKRKSTPPTISPLPPPTSTSNQGDRDRRLSQQPNHMGQQQQQQHLQAGPAYNSGSPVDKVGSYDSGTVKSEKRRSGFFGFGKKDKDKDRDVRGDKDKEVS
jgi:hypothetical protein